METHDNRLSRPHGALVEYWHFVETFAAFESPTKWNSLLETVGITAATIGLTQPYGPILIRADTTAEQILARISIISDRLDQKKYDGVTPDYGDTARVAEREGLWCYDHWALDEINLGSVPSEDVLALVTFRATDDELPAILRALSAHGYGQNLWPGRNLPEFKDIAWGDTLRTT